MGANPDVVSSGNALVPAAQLEVPVVQTQTTAIESGVAPLSSLLWQHFLLIWALSAWRFCDWYLLNNKQYEAPSSATFSATIMGTIKKICRCISASNIPILHSDFAT